MELENHLKNTSSKATYISKTTQNEIIFMCSKLIIDNILNKVKQFPYYSIMFDETTDMSYTSQLCLVIRYINEDYTVQEDFLDFIDPHSYNFENSEIEPKLNAVTQFLTGISEIMDFLHKISNWNDRESSSKAKVLLNSIDCEFVITLYVASHIFSITQPLSVILQKKNFDKQSAVNYINKTIEILNKLRLDGKTDFKNLYFKAVEQMDQLEITVKKPRTISIQHHRQNPEITNVEDYFRVTVYIPFLDFIITDMKSKFTEETLGVYNLGIFVPKILISKIQENTVQIFESIWNQFLNIHGLNGRFVNREAFIGKLQGEMIWWKEYWNREKIDIPDTALKSLEHWSLGCLRHPPVRNANNFGRDKALTTGLKALTCTYEAVVVTSTTGVVTTSSEATFVCLLAARTQAIRRIQEINPELEDIEINSRLVAYCSDQETYSLDILITLT
ncbi:hypothetical protein QTP88_010690 [Uroleucon formosanum]